MIPKEQQVAFEDLALQIRDRNTKANTLLEAAKRSVEIAIEDTEAAALNYLDKILEDTGDC